MKYIRKLAESYPYSYENPPTCKVELWNFSRATENEESRKEAVTTIASISHGNEYAKNPDRLWDLLIERGEESPFEFVRLGGTNETLRGSDISTLGEVVNNEEQLQKAENNEKKYVATFKIKVPIFVARQIMRHRTFSFMEISRRYVKGDKVEFEYWTPNGNPKAPIIFDSENSGWFFTNVKYAFSKLYEYWLQQGLKPEQARAFLPLGLYTKLWMQGDYKAWLNFFIYRLAPEAQEETRLIALSMWSLLRKYQPEIIETMSSYLDTWTEECNPMFKPAREKKAKWFKANYLEGRDENI